MANKARTKGRNQGTPVSKEIRRAAARMGYTPSAEEPEPEAELDRTEEELDTLRSLVRSAELIFEHDGEVERDASVVLREALRSAGEDFGMIADADSAGGGVPTMAFRRAQLRCELAVALFEYRQSFGFPEPVGEVVEQSEVAS